MNRPLRIGAAVAAASLVFAACSSGDATIDTVTETTAAPVTTPEPTDEANPTVEADPTETTVAAGGDEVDPTISPDLPEAFLAGVGPLAIIGEPLPELPVEGDDPAVGMAAPVIIGENFAGEPVRVDPSVDGATWIVFLAHWCPHCNDEIPVINELRDNGGIPDGIDVVGVSTAVNPDRPNYPPGDWLDDKDWTFTAVVDGVNVDEGSFIAATAFGVSGFPFSVLIDADGIVKERWSGGREAAELVSLLTNNLALA